MWSGKTSLSGVEDWEELGRSMGGFSEEEAFDVGPEGWICRSLAHSERRLRLLGQKEDVEKALGFRPGLATRQVQIQLGQGPGNQRAHGVRVLADSSGASWMLRARNAVEWLFHKNQNSCILTTGYLQQNR